MSKNNNFLVCEEDKVLVNDVVKGRDYLDEICLNCDLDFGSHLAWESKRTGIPKDSCPGNAGQMNFEEGGGTTFKGSGEFREVKLGTPAKNRKEA